MPVVNTGFTSVYFNSICLTIAAFIFIVLVLFMYLKKDKVKGLTTNLFIMCLVLNLTCILLEFVVPICIKEILATNDNASSIYYIICKSYIVVAALWDLVYLLYTSVKVQNIKFYYNEETNKFNKYALLVFGVLLIASISFVLLFKMEYNGGINNVPYTIGGPLKVLFDIFTTVGSTYIIVIFTLYSFKIKNINMWQFYFVFTFYLVFLALEYLFDFTYNHLSFVQSLIILTTYFTIESQDNKLLVDYNRAKEDSERANKVKTNFLINMSHEIRTPMNTVIGFGESIVHENNLTEERFKSDFENITKSCYELLGLIDNISYISKLDSGKVEIKNTNYNINDLIYEIFNSIYYKSKDKSIDLKLNVDPSLPKIYEGDYKKINEILYYILVTAINRISNGEITLTINGHKKEENKIDMEYIIEHTGRFYDADLLDNNEDVLEMNNSLKDTSAYNSNMSMLIIKLLVRLLHGKIELGNDTNNSTRYTIKIEQTIKDNTQVGEVSLDGIINEIKNETILDCTGKSVLFIDGNDAIVRMASNYLSQYHFDITLGKSVDECLTYFKSKKYDILFIDYTLMNASGRTAMDELIALGIPLPPIVAIINNNTMLDQNEYNKGYDAYITKPITFNELNNIVYKFIMNNVGGDK